MRAPVRHFTPAVVQDIAEKEVAALFRVGRFPRRAQPEIVIKTLRNRHDGGGRLLVFLHAVHGHLHADGVQFADAAVAH